jgi:putative component of membrane protein insertase Oxa1/YidC/SpoIIIJ protein YidD
MAPPFFGQQCAVVVQSSPTLKLMLSNGAIALIGTYQRYVSPHKGFCCAYRVHTGRSSCSEFARRAIRRLGLIEGLSLLRLRFAACTVSAAVLSENQKTEEVKNEACPLFSKEGASCMGNGCVGACPWP